MQADSVMAAMDSDLNDLLKPVLLKDLRTQCRARGLNLQAPGTPSHRG